MRGYSYLNSKQALKIKACGVSQTPRISLKEGMLSNVQGSISSLVSTVGNMILMYFGIMQVIDGNSTLGSLMAFTTLSGYLWIQWEDW